MGRGFFLRVWKLLRMRGPPGGLHIGFFLGESRGLLRVRKLSRMRAALQVDDGLAVEWLPDGRPRLWVHVADPTRWVRPGEPLDAEARRRGSTMYLPTGARPRCPPLP